jgi:hypothetical protein
MGCWRQYLAISGAGLCGAGSVTAAVITAGVATVPAILGAIGSLMFLTTALDSLATCLRRKGKVKEADRLEERIATLQREVEKLKGLLPPDPKLG